MRRETRLERAADILTGLMLALMLGVCLCASVTAYGLKHEGLWQHPLWLIPGVAALLLLAAGLRLLRRRPRRRISLWGATAVLFCLLFLYQCQLAQTAPWDGYILYTDTGRVAADDGVGNLTLYLSYYPNNRLLAAAELIVWKLTLLLGGGSAYLPLLALNCAMTAAAFHLLHRTAELATGSRAVAWLAWLLCVVFIGLNPIVSVIYSDVPAMLLICLGLYLTERFRRTEHRPRTLALLGVTAVLAWKLKPQAAIVEIAAALLVLLPEAFTLRRAPLRVLKGAACLLLAAALTLGAVSALCAILPEASDPSLAVGPTHYLMMGLNPDTMGAYSAADLQLTESFAAGSDRVIGNLSIAWQRMKKMGFTGLLLHELRKLTTCSADGTLGWIEYVSPKGMPYWTETPLTMSAVSEPLRNAVQSDAWFCVWQALWLGLLCFSLLSCFRPDGLSLARLTVLGLILFLLIFETGSRYVFQASPLFCLLAASGLQRFAARPRKETVR